MPQSDLFWLGHIQFLGHIQGCFRTVSAWAIISVFEGMNVYGHFELAPLRRICPSIHESILFNVVNMPHMEKNTVGHIQMYLYHVSFINDQMNPEHAPLGRICPNHLQFVFPSF